jgi:hypothetical protein
MEKSSNTLSDPFASVGDTVPYARRLFGPDLIDNPASIFHMVQQDHGLDKNKKRSLLHILNSPEVFDHLLAGAAGMVIAKAISSYSEMSKPARTLLSLAGFGIGNIIYNRLQEQKFSKYNTETGMSKIKL